MARVEAVSRFCSGKFLHPVGSSSTIFDRGTWFRHWFLIDPVCGRMRRIGPRSLFCTRATHLLLRLTACGQSLVYQTLTHQELTSQAIPSVAVATLPCTYHGRRAQHPGMR